jgi:hypothetical protein
MCAALASFLFVVVSGWNAWESMEGAAGALELYGASLPPNTTGPAVRPAAAADYARTQAADYVLELNRSIFSLKLNPSVFSRPGSCIFS